MYFVCQRVLWFRYWKVSSSTVCLLEVLVSKVSSDPFFFVVVLWVYSLSDGFFRFSMFVRVLGVRTLLQVLWFGVLEVSRFKCQRISSGLVFQFEGLDQRFLQILFFLLLFCGFKVCQMVSSGSLCLSEFWVSIHCFRFFGLVFQRFQDLNVRGFLCSVFQFELRLRFGYQMILRFSWQRVVFQGKYFRLSEV